jgi:membrane-associated phospholipid phosphatase
MHHDAKPCMHSLDAPAPVRVALTREPEAAHATCWINVQDRGLAGRGCELLVVLGLRDMEDGSLREKVLHRQSLILRHGRLRLELPPNLSLYLYVGPGLSLRPALRLVDRAGTTLVQRTLSESRACLIGGRPRLDTCAQALMQPRDAWSVFANFSALAAGARWRIAVLTLVTSMLIIGNLGIGIHDQWFAGQPRTSFSAMLEEMERKRRSEPPPPPARSPYVYHRHSRGFPITDAAFLSLAFGYLGWGLLRSQFSRYAWLEINLMLPPLRPGLRLPAHEVVRGRIDTALRHATLRVVAANLECVERVKGRERVAVRSPVRAVLLYQCELRRVAAGSNLVDLIDGEIDFSPMFNALYPAQMLDARWGVDIAWQVQLIHPELVDLAVEGPVHSLRFVDFISDLPTRIRPPTGAPA